MTLFSAMFNPFGKPVKKVYGPYTARTNRPRRYMLFLFKDGTKTSMSHARWLMTQHLHRRLTADETVDHVDEDPMNDSLDNLQLLSRAENARKSTTGRPSPQRGHEKGFRHGTIYAWMKKKCTCPECTAHRNMWNKDRAEARKK